MVVKHKFGGVWTRKKLVILDEYLKFYTTALKNMPFKLHYADAFAGTGSHDPVIDGEQNILIPNEDFRGSVLTALSVDPGFYQYHFNDLNPEHVEALNELRKEFPERNIRVSKLDANRFVPKFCNTLGPDDRAILFLDPYSTHSLKALSHYLGIAVFTSGRDFCTASHRIPSLLSPFNFAHRQSPKFFFNMCLATLSASPCALGLLFETAK